MILPLLGEAASEQLYAEDYLLQVESPQFLHGRSFQSISLLPILVSDGKLHSLREAGLRIRFASGEDSKKPIRPLRPDFPLRERVLRSLGRHLLNPESLPLASDRAVGGSGFPTEAPSLEGSTVEMVIVTVDSLADLCQVYANSRSGWGVPTVVRTVEWMEGRYPMGSDRAEMIRNFVKDAYEKWSIRFLLIVGDVEVMPVRHAFSTFFADDRLVPTDLYFSCLDGSWNGDQDSHWCEPGGGSVVGDEADLLPEIATGRIPSGNREECELHLQKAMDSQNCVVPDYQNSLLFLGEVLFPKDWNLGDTIYSDGAAYCESVTVNATDASHDLTRLYENYYEFPGSSELSRSASIAALNAGPSVVLHNGHGGRQAMSVGDASINSNDVDHLTNGQETFLLYMVNCNAAAFEYNSLAENFLQNPQGGAHAVIGSTNETYSNICMKYQNEFFYTLYDDPSLSLGELYVGSLNAFHFGTSSNSVYRWTHQTLTLLGDPSSWVFYDLPDPISVSHPSSYEAGSGPLTVSVSSVSGDPWPGARVCLQKGTEDYQVVYSDGNGDASFDPAMETSGVYQIHVDARKANSWAGMLFATLPSSASWLSIGSVQVDDTDDGVVDGNGNGIAERGETFRILMDLQNQGDTLAGNVTATLSSVHPELTVLAGSDVFQDIPASSSASGQMGYLVQVGEIPDDEILPFDLTISHDAGILEDDFFLEAASPLLGLFRSEIDDTASGNGNGEIEVGESVSLLIHLENRGRGIAPSVQASIEAPDTSSLQILQPISSLGDLPALSTDLGPAGFEILRLNANEPTLRLLLQDQRGRTDTLSLDLQRPLPLASSPEFDYRQNASEILVNWEMPEGEELLGFRLERADEEAGPYAEVTPDWAPSASYLDQGLSPFTGYWYRVLPISSSCLSASPSPAGKVTTNPAMKSGWPREMASETAGTPALVDIDGDGSLEIFAGADDVYGFYANAEEIFDGDADPYTTGPISSAGDKYFCAMSAGDLITGGAEELVGGSWNSQEVYVWEFVTEGDSVVAEVAPGWPQSVPSVTGIWASPSMGDVDGDGDLEIFTVDISGTLMAWHHDGTEVLDGDENPSTQGIFDSGLGPWSRSTPNFADIDGNGDMEIIVAGGLGVIYAYDSDGSQMPGFPVNLGASIYSSTSIADIDGDGSLEIAIAAKNDSLYVLEHDGTHYAGWPIYMKNHQYSYWMAPSIAFGDITGDHRPEMFITSFGHDLITRAGWMDRLGNWMPGWPVETVNPGQSSPVIGDLDGDGDLEAILANESGVIEAWHHDASAAEGFPIHLGDAVIGTPTLADVDGDGYLDMVLAGWDKFLYVWEFPTEYNSTNNPWYTFLHDQMRSGNEETLDWVIGVDVGVEDIAPANLVRLDANWPNPFNPETRIRFTLHGEQDSNVRLSIHDVQGRRIALLVDGKLPPGVYERNWQGRDDLGHSLSSGVYFARLRVGDRVETRKMTLLK
ncbi:MAG: C25 family cysteine peptidase [Candidatus Krumholzibacteria bacterium]|nr:C25 family cysteine peptidase [Candidatus Krumholzibacteria bacterium]